MRSFRTSNVSLRLRDTDGDKIEFRLAPDGKLQEFVNDRLELPEVHYLRYRGTTGVVQDSTGDFKLRKANRNQKARVLQVLAEFAGVPCSFRKIRPVGELKLVDCDQDVILFRRSSKLRKLQLYINGALEPQEVDEIAYNLEEGLITTRVGYFYIKPEERFEKAWLLRHFCYQAKVDWSGDEPLLWTTRPYGCSLEGPSTDTEDAAVCDHDSGNVDVLMNLGKSLKQLKQSEGSAIAERLLKIASLTGVVRPGSETLPKRRQRKQAREQLERNRLMKANEPEKFNDSDPELEFEVDSQVEIERLEAANRRFKEQCAWMETSDDEADQLKNETSKLIQENMPAICDGSQLSSDTDGNQLSSDSDSQLEIERLEAANKRFQEECGWMETSDEEAEFTKFAKEKTQACQGCNPLRWLVVDEHSSEGQAGNSSWQSVLSGDEVVVETEASALEMHESFSSSGGEENVSSESIRTPQEDDANADHKDRCISNSQDLDDDILQRLCEEGAIDESILHSPEGILQAPASQDTVPPHEDESLAEGSDAVSSHMDETHGERGWELLTNEEDLPSTIEPGTEWFLLCNQEDVELPADDGASFACSIETRSINDDDWHWEAPRDAECFVLSEGEDDECCTHEICSSPDQCVGTGVESPHSCGMHDSACQVRQAPTYMTSQTLQRNTIPETGLENLPCTTLTSC
jgi:hypothetical protein